MSMLTKNNNNHNSIVEEKHSCTGFYALCRASVEVYQNCMMVWFMVKNDKLTRSFHGWLINMNGHMATSKI